MADKEAARKSGRPLVISQTPDVCLTPIGGTMVPVHYPVTADLSEALKVSPNVNFGGKPAFTLSSQTPDVKGDEAGSGGGVKSGTVGGKCEPIQGSSTVRVNGQPVIRHGDRFTMNNGNTIGKLVYVEGGGGVASIDGATTPPDADEDFFTRIADRLDAEAELVGDVADKVQALDSDPPEKPKALSKEHVKIDANPGDGIKISGTEQGPPDPNKTKLCIGYTKAPGHKLHGEYHAFVTAENPLTGEKFITRAGPSADSPLQSSGASISSASGGSLSASSGDGRSGGFGFGTIRARYGIWDEASPFDKPSNTVHQQCEGEVDLPYDQVVDRMVEFARVTNGNKIPYFPVGPNSNSYAFAFLESLGMPRPEPDLSVLGHNLGFPGKQLSYYP